MSLKLRSMIGPIVFLLVSACSPQISADEDGSSALAQPKRNIKVCLLKPNSGVYGNAVKERALEDSIPLGWVRSKSFGYEVVGEETVKQTVGEDTLKEARLLKIIDHQWSNKPIRFVKKRNCELKEMSLSDFNATRAIRVCLLKANSGLFDQQEDAVQTTTPEFNVRPISFEYEVLSEETVKQTDLVKVVDHLHGKHRYVKKRDCTVRNALDWFPDDGR
jgi:hypothetical protein